jgi:copper chaperone CopZ
MSARSLRLAVALALPLSSGAAAVADAPKPAPAPPRLETVYLEWSALKAEQGGGVASAVRALAGVKTFEWRIVNKEAAVVREEGKAADAALLLAAGAPGAPAARIPAAGATLTFKTPLHCGNCAKKVRSKLGPMAGVKDVTVSANLKTVHIVWDTRAANREQFAKALADIGFPTQPAP